MHSAVAKIHICTSFYTLSDLVWNNFLSIYLQGPSKNIFVFLHFSSHLSPELLSMTNNQSYQINNFMDVCFLLGNSPASEFSKIQTKVSGEFAASVCGILHVEVTSTSKMLINVNSTTS
jgi:hypothetical protein